VIAPSGRPPVHKASESRASVAVGVGLGLLAGSFIVFLWVVFAGAAAGNSGATSYFSKTFMPVSLGVFALYVVIALALFFLRRDRLAILLAWLPVILIFFVWPAVGSIARLFGAK